MNRRTTGVVLGVAALLVLLAISIPLSMAGRGFSTHDEPGAVEAAIARRMRAWAVPPDLRKETNPVPASPVVIEEGLAHFADHCAGCHGNDGRGSSLGRRMYPPVPDMTLPATQTRSDGELFAVIENGVRLTGMPGFGSGTAGSARDSWTLVHFIRHLPQLTPEERGRMEQLNPKAPGEWQRIQGNLPPAPAADSHDHTGHRH